MPLGDVSFTYDTTISRLATMTDGKGQLWSYDYDPLDRLKKITLDDGSTVRFTYDPDGNLTDRIDPSGTWHFVYDDLNRMTENSSTPVGVQNPDPSCRDSVVLMDQPSEDVPSADLERIARCWIRG